MAKATDYACTIREAQIARKWEESQGRCFGGGDTDSILSKYLLMEGLLMYVYIDESGNSGLNMFDSDQKFFYLIAVVSKVNIQNIFSRHFDTICSKYNIKELHGNELGLTKMSNVCFELKRILKKINPKLALIYINKEAYVATKLFDTILDSGENYGVATHHYNLRPLRSVLLAKFLSIVDTDILKEFWKGAIEKNKESSRTYFVSCMKMIAEKLSVNKELDLRSKEIFNNSVDFAIKYSDNISFYNDKKLSLMISPNVTFFIQLSRIVEKQRCKWNSNDVHVIHDEQSQFSKSIKEWHKIFSDVDAPKYINVGMDTIDRFKLLEGSSIKISSSSTEYGLQLADCLLYLYKNKDKISKKSELYTLVSYIKSKSIDEYRMDFDQIIVEAEMWYNLIMNTNVDEEKGKEMVASLEKQRLRKLAEYEKTRENIG